jgi:hypothetical protein
MALYSIMEMVAGICSKGLYSVRNQSTITCSYSTALGGYWGTEREGQERKDCNSKIIVVVDSMIRK